MSFDQATVFAVNVRCLSKRCTRLVGLLPCLVWLAGVSVNAQNFVKNPDFEEPLGSNNWTVVYVYGGPSDFAVHDRTTIAHKDKVPGTWDGHPNFLDVYGAEFQPYHDGKMHAYFKQTVSGLQPGSNYVVSCWMVHFTDLSTNTVLVYLEAMGGPAGNVSRLSPYVYKYCNNNPSAWEMYAVTNSASANGQIEVRLHFDKNKWTTFQWEYIRAYYDRVAVMRPGQAPPPFKILSLTLSNRTTATFKWETVMNNTYRLDVSPDLTSWSIFRDELLATGTNLILTTNVTMGSNTLKYYRILSRNYQP